MRVSEKKLIESAAVRIKLFLDLLGKFSSNIFFTNRIQGAMFVRLLTSKDFAQSAAISMIVNDRIFRRKTIVIIEEASCKSHERAPRKDKAES